MEYSLAKTMWLYWEWASSLAFFNIFTFFYLQYKYIIFLFKLFLFIVITYYFIDLFIFFF